MADDTYLGNNLLKGLGVRHKFTKEEIEEYIKCHDDPIYFLENYVKIVHVDEGLVPFKMYDFQKNLVNTITENRNVIVKTGRQVGKCQIYESLITIRNKKTGEIKKIKIGDFYNEVKGS